MNSRQPVITAGAEFSDTAWKLNMGRCIAGHSAEQEGLSGPLRCRRLSINRDSPVAVLAFTVRAFMLAVRSSHHPRGRFSINLFGGVNLKAVTEFNESNKLDVFFVDCPACGKKQIVGGHELISITKD